MTYEKAYEILDCFPRCNGCQSDPDFIFTCDQCDDAFKKALDALKEKMEKGE